MAEGHKFRWSLSTEGIEVTGELSDEATIDELLDAFGRGLMAVGFAHQLVKSRDLLLDG